MPRKNPYLNRSMIRSLEGFFGRSREIERTMARLGDATPQSVSIVGERRVGKSSLLWHLAQPEVAARYLDDPASYVFLYLDFQGQRHLDLSGFSRAFCDRLAEAVQDRAQVAEATSLTQLEATLRQVTEADLRVICLFDEFEAVTSSAAFGQEFFGFLRSLANSCPVAYVTTSRQELQSLCRSQEISESPFFNIFSRIALGPLGPAAAQRLVSEPSAAAGQPLDEHLDDVVALGGQLPLFLQIACSAAFECLEETGELQAELLLRRFREEADGHLDYLWEHLEEDEQDALGALLSGRAAAAPVLERLRLRGHVRPTAAGLMPFSTGLAPLLTEHGLLGAAATARAGPESTQAAAPSAPSPPAAQSTQAMRLPPTPAGESPFPEIVGSSEELRRAFSFIQRAAASDVTVVLLGETGTGKELVARTIHQHSDRRDGPFVVVNCGAIAEHLQESELFGHRKGAFTDAIADRQGLIEAADGGTLLLDEIAEMTPATQVKLLRVLQEREVRRVGDSEPNGVDVRVIGATNRDLDAEVEAGRFREDLYYRLCVLVTKLPPLRDRRQDIPCLVEHFVIDGRVDPEALGLLQAHDWPGNVRELENQLAAARALAGDDPIRPLHLWPRLQGLQPVEPAVGTGDDAAASAGSPWHGMTLRQAREAFERDLLERRLQQFDDDLTRVADSLSVSRSRLYELVRKYGLRSA